MAAYYTVFLRPRPALFNPLFGAFLSWAFEKLQSEILTLGDVGYRMFYESFQIPIVSLFGCVPASLQELSLAPAAMLDGTKHPIATGSSRGQPEPEIFLILLQSSSNPSPKETAENWTSS